jgi:PAS domain S-box-containing protein
MEERPHDVLSDWSAQELHFALDAAHIFVWDWNLATGATRRCGNAAQMFGLRSGQAHDFLTLLHPDDHASMEAAVAAARKGDTYEVECRLITPEGQIVWLLDKGRLRLDPVTGEEHLSGVCFDITERKRALEEREQALRTLNNLVAAAPLGIALLDRELRFHLVNAPLAEMNGHSIEAHLGRRLHEIVPDLEAQVRPIVNQVLDTGRAVRDKLIEGETCKAPGVQRAWRENWFAVPGPGGKPAIAGAIVQEITEQRRAEHRLSKRNQRLRLLSEASAILLRADDPNVMVSVLFEKIGPHLGLDTYFHFMVNDTGDALRLASCVGISEETSRSLTRLEFGQAICGTVALHRQPVVATYIQQSDDPMVGLVKSFAIRTYACYPLVSGELLLGTLSFASRSRDELDADEVEFLRTICDYVTVAYERVRLVKQLQDSDRRKDEFLAVLAHELRNPLAPIRNSLQLLRMGEGNGEILEQARRVMERQLEHMVHLIDDLLDVSRITRGKILLRKERVDLATAVQSALEASRPQITASNHEFTATLPSEPIDLDADPTRLSQVFSNLLTNAVKYTDRAGRIWLTAERLSNHAVVTVRDTGIGIPAEHLPHVFEMFSQGAPALERSQGGLGIGLSLVKGLVEMHGGTVEAYSDGPGKGSQFTVRLPVLDTLARPSVEPDPDASASAASSPSRILVVDDNRDSVESLAMVLRLHGHQVQTARDGVEAVQAAAAFRPNLVLLDIGLPKMNGYEAARRIRHHDWGKRMVLVAMTGWGQDEDKRRALEAGFDHHMTKPVDPVALEKLVAVLTLRKR